MNTTYKIAPALLATGLVIIALLAWRGTMSMEGARIVAIVFACIVLWATGAVAGLLVSLLFFLLAVTPTSVPAAEIFSGFASSAFWLVLSGAAIGFALKESGLSERIGMALARCIGGSYLRALLAFAVLSFVVAGDAVYFWKGGDSSSHCRRLLRRRQARGVRQRGRRGILLLVIVRSYELAAAALPVTFQACPGYLPVTGSENYDCRR